MDPDEQLARELGGRVVDSAADPDEALAAELGGRVLPPDLSTGESIVGGAEALARGATFGLSDRASDAIQGGIRSLAGEGSYGEARDQAAAEREHRAEGLGGTGTALEAAGAVAPALLSRGASAPASAARILPAGAAAAAAEAVAGQVAKRFGPGIMSGIAQTALGAAAGGAIASGVTALAEKLPLFGPDPLEAAEQVFWEAGKGALTGLGLGGALGAVAGGARAALQLGGRAANAAGAAAERFAPAAAARRAWKSVAYPEAAHAHMHGPGPELEAAGGVEAVGRILLEEGIPLVGGKQAQLGQLETKLAAASKTVLDLQGEVEAGTAAPGMLHAAALREQALMVARDAAAGALERAPQKAASAGLDAAMGAGMGLAAGGAPGAVLGAAAGRLARGAVAGERAGIEALALDQLAHLAGQRAGLVSAADRVGKSVESIARVSGRAGAALAPLRDKDVGPALDQEIARAQELLDPQSPAQAALQAQAAQLDMVEPGLGQGYAQAARRRAELMSEGVSPRLSTLMGGEGGDVDPISRLRLARRSIALANPEAALARIAKGVDSHEDANVISKVYPRVWARFTQALAERMRNQDLSYTDAVELGVRTGLQTVPSLSADSILSAQLSAQESAQAQAAEQQAAAANRPDFGTKGWAGLERYGDKADRLAARGSER